MLSNKFYDELAALIVASKIDKANDSLIEAGLKAIMPPVIEDQMGDEIDNAYALYNELGISFSLNNPIKLRDQVINLLALNHIENGYELTLAKYQLQKRGVTHEIFNNMPSDEDTLFEMLYKMITNYNIPKILYDSLVNKGKNAWNKVKRVNRLGVAVNELGIRNNPYKTGVVKDVDVYSAVENLSSETLSNLKGNFLIDNDLLFGCYANVGTANSGKQLINNIFLSSNIDANCYKLHISCGERADVLLKEQHKYGLISNNGIKDKLEESKILPDLVDLIRYILDQKSLISTNDKDNDNMIIIINSITSVLGNLSNKGSSKAGINRQGLDKLYALLQFLGEQINAVIICTHRVDRNEIDAGIVNMILGNTWGVIINKSLLQDRSLLDVSDDSLVRTSLFRFINKQAKPNKLRFKDIDYNSIIKHIGDLVHIKEV